MEDNEMTNEKDISITIHIEEKFVDEKLKQIQSEAAQHYTFMCKGKVIHSSTMVDIPSKHRDKYVI